MGQGESSLSSAGPGRPHKYSSLVTSTLLSLARTDLNISHHPLGAILSAVLCWGLEYWEPCQVQTSPESTVWSRSVNGQRRTKEPDRAGSSRLASPPTPPCIRVWEVTSVSEPESGATLLLTELNTEWQFWILLLFFLLLDRNRKVTKIYLKRFLVLNKMKWRW